MFKDLDTVLHSQLRLAIVSILMGVEEAEFSALKKMTKATAGNLSLQLEKLKEQNYITVEKSFKNKYPVTKCKITKTGMVAFELYVKCIKEYLDVEQIKRNSTITLLNTKEKLPTKIQ